MSDDPNLSLQERLAPKSVCFGCGPANEKGLHIASFVDGDEVICDFTPQPYHNAFPGVLNGGMVGTLLDCHCNWTAAYHLMEAAGDGELPSTVTAEYTIKMLRPTPMDGALHLRARVVEMKAPRAAVEGEIHAGGKVTATCRGTFVAVKPGHPAYHRW
jgi:acyl-coenzyme A thioesterase PaaI-like protein